MGQCCHPTQARRVSGTLQSLGASIPGGQHQPTSAATLRLRSWLAGIKTACLPLPQLCSGYLYFLKCLASVQINLIDEADIKALMDELAPSIAEHHARALNPAHPHQRGTAQGPDVYMQAIEAANPFHDVSAVLSIYQPNNKSTSHCAACSRCLDVLGGAAENGQESSGLMTTLVVARVTSCKRILLTTYQYSALRPAAQAAA